MQLCLQISFFLESTLFYQNVSLSQILKDLYLFAVLLVYLNSLLATLNAQWLFQHQASDDDHLSIPLSKISPAHIALNPESTISQPVSLIFTSVIRQD